MTIRRLGTLAVALLASIFVAYALQLTIAIRANSDLEHLAAMAFLVLLALVSTLVFAIALFRGEQPFVLRRVALVLGALSLLVVLALIAFNIWESGSARTLGRDLPLFAQLAFPPLLAIAVQWWLVRRRRRRELRTR